MPCDEILKPHRPSNSVTRGWSRIAYAISPVSSTLLTPHQDVFQQNFLCNYYGGLGYHVSYAPPSPGEPIKPFRQLFPFKVYLIDFEWAVCYDLNSDPSTHLVFGRPGHGLATHGSNTTYSRPVAPEMDLAEPHNPFLADVWQLGTYFRDMATVHMSSL